MLSSLDHDGILPAVEHVPHEEKPTVFFEHPAEAVRLDHFMARERRIKPATRYAILEQVAEAVRYAHEHKVIHRAINPRSILVVPGEKEDRPGVRLLNWHTGRMDDQETGTRHVSHYLHETSKTFLAPELKHSPSVGEPADVFGLGALAYYLFTGRPPGPDIQTVIQRLAARGGLRPAVDKDDIGSDLDELVYDATRSAPDKRLSTVSEFISALSDVREQVVSLNYDLTDPLEAANGDRLGPYTIEERIGTGSTAAAFEAVTEDERTVVLKIAKSDAHEPRLEAEAEALQAIDAELVVDLLDVTVLGGRRTLVLQSAGDTLLDKLREQSALSLFDQMRFGEDLCQILVDLEEANVFHRDIKPSNLGVARPKPGSSSLHLMLFDFSLKGVDVENVDVGTRVYRDPFLGPAGRNTWDVHADRYSAAVVLHEMVTQRLPRWGDEHANPLADSEAELQIETERLPAPIRDGLDSFFRSALARDVDDRFDTARAMLESWREIY
ncbi:MAG: protein kinase, partial [Bradymonadaceae bacterium]